MHPERPGPAGVAMTHRITVTAPLGRPTLDRIGEVVTITAVDAGPTTTTFDVAVTDQADLYGVLLVLQRYGVGLQSVVEVPAGS